MYKGRSVGGLSLETEFRQSSCQDFPLKLQGIVH